MIFLLLNINGTQRISAKECLKLEVFDKIRHTPIEAARPSEKIKISSFKKLTSVQL